MHKINEDGTISIIKPTLTIDEANIIGTLKAQHAIEMQKLKDEINQLKAKNEQLRKEYKIVREINDAYYEKYVKNRPVLKSVTYNPPATIAFWEDGTKTVSKCSKKDVFSKECGLALCYMYKMFGKKETKEILKEHCWTIPAHALTLTTDGSTITASKLTINCTENMPEEVTIYRNLYKYRDMIKEIVGVLNQVTKNKNNAFCFGLKTAYSDCLYMINNIMNQYEKAGGGDDAAR